MNNYPIITKKIIKDNEALKKIQKENKKKYGRKMLFGYPKASIPKVIIENGYIDMVGKQEHREPKDFKLSELLIDIEKSGLTGMSGNNFPTYKKLKSAIAATAKNKIIIINGAECDPGLIHDAWLIRNKLEDIIFGSKLVSEMINASEVFLATKLIKNEVIEGIKVKNLPNRYPIGAERILIEEVLKVKIDKNEIPVKKGILVLNVQTIAAIAEIAQNKFLKGSRYITVADYFRGEAKVARVDYNMKAKEVLERIFGKQTNKVIYAGSGIMGAHEIYQDENITPEVNFVGYSYKMNYDNASKCKKCGTCTRNCPMGVKVNKIVSCHEKNIRDNISQYGLEDCINCGTCSFLCKAGKNTMEIVNMY